jgi:hypothetical protein
VDVGACKVNLATGEGGGVKVEIGVKLAIGVGAAGVTTSVTPPQPSVRKRTIKHPMSNFNVII